jgi:hypothetical protein
MCRSWIDEKLGSAKKALGADYGIIRRQRQERREIARGLAETIVSTAHSILKTGRSWLVTESGESRPVAGC